MQTVCCFFNCFNLKNVNRWIEWRAVLNGVTQKKCGAGKVVEEKELFLQLSDPSFFL